MMPSKSLDIIEQSYVPAEPIDRSRPTAVEFQNGNGPDGSAKKGSLCKEPSSNKAGIGITEGSADTRSQMASPIAICGMALRLPGGVKSPEEFWKFLIEKRNGLCEVPETRYNIDTFYSESRPHSIKTRKGYFLQDDPACFDADFFSISPREAGRMDPQQRQLLEVVWECLESAGETEWRGKEIGCFVGVYGEDWIELASQDIQNTDRYHVLGTGQFALSNRVSYEFDFQGPSMTLQTGCSSSLVGLHEACQAIYSGECSAAIVAGTNLIFAPTMTTTMSENMVLSPSGICRTFDEKADGYGRGEAINAIFIKPLEEALRSNDPIRAVIRATSTNSDGKTPSITTPGSISQERLIRKAYRKAFIENISQTGFFECHGTGTTIGDTAETSVVSKIFENKGVIIGACKPNVGHSEGASGITSVIKAALALENQKIPPNIFFDSPNPNIPFKETGLHVPTSVLPWPNERVERVSVNCFGIGGANAHAVIDSRLSFLPAGEGAKETAQQQLHGARLLVVTARSPESLQKRVKGIADYANENPDSLFDLAFTLSLRREHLNHRAFAVAVPNKLLDESNFQTGQMKKFNLNFVFTGQGAQWAGMGKDLIEQFHTFRDDIDAFDNELKQLPSPPSWSLKEELSKPTGNVNGAELSQPLCTAVQLGIVNLLERMGVRPSSVTGHSSGEIAAAYAAGAITARSALIIAYYRGVATQQLEGKGAMLAVGLGRREISDYLREDVVLACENSPKSVTLSGDRDAIRSVSERIKEDLPDVLCRSLRVKIAYHSHHMKESGPVYESQIMPWIEHRADMLPLFSTVNSQPIQEPKELNAAYWRQNLESPVLFSDAIKGILASDSTNGHCFIEIGPHSALSGPLRQIFNSSSLKTNPVYIPTMTRHADDSRSQILNTVGSVYLLGGTVNFQEANGEGKTLTNLPSYPWQHTSRHWHESRLASQWRQRTFSHHELLGSRVVESSDLEPSWRNILRMEDVPWIWDHVLQGNVVFPAAGYISMAGEAVLQLHPDVEDYSIKDLILKTPLLLKDQQATEMITALRPCKINDLMDSEWFSFSILAYDGVEWTKHCQGQVRSHFDFQPSKKNIESHLHTVESDQWYRALDKHGLSYGSSFQGLTDIAADPVRLEANAAVNIRLESCPSRYTLHPTAIDQCLQLMSVALTNGISRRIDRLAIPAAIGRLYIGGQAPVMHTEARLEKSKIGAMAGSSSLISEDGKLLLELDQAAFFTVQDLPVDERIPLTAEIRWTPDIDVTPPDVWLPRPFECGTEEFKAARDNVKVSLLYILETAEIIGKSSPLESHLIQYKDWVLGEGMKIRNGNQEHLSEGIKWAAHMTSEERRKLIREISVQQDTGEFSGWLQCASAIFDNCLDLMSGKQSPLDLLLENNRLGKLYDSASLFRRWSRVIQLMGLQNPSLRILEIGAGTGAYTRKVLEHLKSAENVHLYSKYVFSDVSPGFTVAAQEEFGSMKNIEFKVLDISRDVEEQGFQPHSFDIIIASNVLHATPSLKASLQNIHQLLVSTGKLILQELSPISPTVGYVMGLLPGWWIGEDDGRPGVPYVSPDRWNLELRAAGFTGSKEYAYDVEPPFQFNFTMISGVSQEPSEKVVTLVTSNFHSPWVSNLTSRFHGNDYVVKNITLDDRPEKNADLIFLLDLDDPFLYGLEEQEFLRLQRFMLGMTGRGLWVTNSTQLDCQDPRYGLVLGLARTLRIEHDLDISIFETETFDDESANALYRVFKKIECSRGVRELLHEYEYSYQNAVTYVGRCHWATPGEEEKVMSETKEGVVTKLDIGTEGLLDTLCWSEIAKPELKDDEVEVKIQYVGLNFRDILVALGVIGRKEQIGLESSGVIQRLGSKVKGLVPGDRVFTFYPGLMQSEIITTPDWCYKVPDNVSLEDAATMPSVYATAIYSLIELCSLKRGQTVLIHSACGGVGIAAIQICHLLGAEVFATVGNDEKVQYLMTRFGIPRNRIFNSRSKEFQPQILRETKGRGVDIVINSLAGELLHASWECVATRGKMVELGKRDFFTNGMLSMGQFASNRAFFGVDILSLCEDSPEVLKDLFPQILDWAKQGKIEPIRPVKAFAPSEILDAFRYMQQGVHMGKIVVKAPCDSNDPPLVKRSQNLNFSPQRSYLLVGGLGGLGRAISTWMVENGARHLVYLSRSAGKSKNDQDFLQELKMCGAYPVCVAGDVSSQHDVEHAISQCTKPLAGVLQMSLSLADQNFSKMTFQEWESSLSPKVKGTLNLHESTLNAQLDFFVVLSSICGLCGNSGQANYAAANTFLDAFSLYRRKLGLPCSSLALGLVEDIGLVSRNPKMLQRGRASGNYILGEEEVLRGLKVAMDRSRASLTSPTIIGLKCTKPTSDSNVRFFGNHDMRYAIYYNMEASDTGSSKASDDGLRALLIKLEQNPGLIDELETQNFIRGELGKLLTQHMPDTKNMEEDEISKITLDSLMSIEIRGWARRNLKLEISLAEITKAGTVGNLGDLVIAQLRAKYCT